MIDQTHTKSMPAHSGPIVFAALITTSGVIVAAFIQSGYFGKPTPPIVAVSQPTLPVAQASFLGTVEPLAELSMRAEHESTAVVNYKPITSSSNIEPVAALMPAVNTPARLPAAEASAADAPKTFASPWTALSAAAPQPKRAETVKPAKKPSEGNLFTRFLRGLD